MLSEIGQLERIEDKLELLKQVKTVYRVYGTTNNIHQTRRGPDSEWEQRIRTRKSGKKQHTFSTTEGGANPSVHINREEKGRIRIRQHQKEVPIF